MKHQFEERGREESPLGTTGFSFLCLFFAAAYSAFAALVTKYRHSIIQVNATEHLDQRSNNNKLSSGALTDFVRMPDWDEKSGHTAPVGEDDGKKAAGEKGGDNKMPWSSIISMEMEAPEPSNDDIAPADEKAQATSKGWKRPWAFYRSRNCLYVLFVDL